MSDHAIFALGVFVTLLLAGGVIMTIIEMSSMPEDSYDPEDHPIFKPNPSSTEATRKPIP
jgi:hypothetical protein